MASVTLKGNPIHTNGHLPKVGSKSPDFILVDAELNNKSLKDFKGKKKILYVVPSLDTSVCSLSTKKFNQNIASLHDVMLLVISADLPFAQSRYCAAENVKNIKTLSMMRTKDFAKDFGLLIQDGPLAGIAARAIIVLDAEDQIVYTELVPEITQEPNYDKALAAVK